MQRRDQVVVLFAGLVVQQNALLQSVVDDLVSDLCRLLSGLLLRECSSHFQYVVGTSGIAARVASDFLQHVGGGSYLHRAQAAVRICKSPLQQLHNLVFRQRLEHIDAAARE